jgi:membrane-bound metal-dependent hydrolase YbcI (DUF457 family)
MLRRNHRIIALSITTAITLPLKLTLPQLLLVEITTLITANLPDIDQRLPFLKHRGITHTIWSWLIITATIFYLTNNTLISIIASISYLSHLIIDSLSIAGIRWFGPFTNNPNDSKYGIYLGYDKYGKTVHHHFNFHGYRVGSPLEYIITAAFGICYIITLESYLLI